MADAELNAAPPLKRRRVESDDANSTRSSPDHNSLQSPTHRLAIRDRDIRPSGSISRSQSGSRLRSRSRSRRTRTRSGSRSRTRSRSPTQSRSRSRNRGRSRSRGGRSSSDSRSRSRTRSGSRGRRYYDSSDRSLSPRSGSGSRSRSRSRSRSELRSQSRTDSRSTTRSSRRSPYSSPPRTDGASPLALPPHSRTPTPPSLPAVRPPNFVPCLSLHGHTGPVSQVRLSPDGRWIASASADGTARIWDAATGAHMETLVGHMAGINTVAWAPDSSVLATGSDDKIIRCWDRRTGRPAHNGGNSGGGSNGGNSRSSPRPLIGHHNYVYCLAFSPQGNVLASGSYDEAVFLWDVRGARILRDLPAHSDPVSGIDFSPDGTLVCSCSTDGLIRIWDTSTGQCLRTLVHEDNPPISSVCFSPNGRYVLASSLDSSIRLWDYIEGRGTVKRTYQGHVSTKYAVGGCFCNTGDLLLVGPDDDETRPHGGAADGMLLLDNGGEDEVGVVGGKELVGIQNTGASYVVSGSEDGDVVVWDVRNKSIVQRISPAHDGVCFWVDVKGDTMVSAGQDKVIKVFRNGNAPVKVSREAEADVDGDEEMMKGIEGGANHGAATREGDVMDVDAPVVPVAVPPGSAMAVASTAREPVVKMEEI